MSRFHEPDGSSRAEYAVWHEPQLSTYVCGGMRRRFGECFLYPSCASASPTIPQSKRPVNPQRYLFFMRSLLAAFAVGWTAPYPERREEYVNAAFSRYLRERGGRNAGPLFVAVHLYVRRRSPDIACPQRRERHDDEHGRQHVDHGKDFDAAHAQPRGDEDDAAAGGKVAEHSRRHV